MSPTSRVAAALAAACAGLPLATAAQSWPTKPIRFITAFAAGGSSDTLARMITEPLTQRLGQPIIIDNRSGGNGVAGTALAAKAPPDGYTFLVVFDAHATNPTLSRDIPYDTQRDFAPVMLFATSPYTLVVAPGSAYRGVADVIAAAKAKPGALTLGSSGVGSRGHLATELLAQRAGFRFTQIPYRGPAQAITDVIGGQISMQMGTFFFALPFVKAARVRGLAVTSAARMPQLPDVPTVAEQGFAGYEVKSWWGLVAPAAVPAPIVQQMHAALADVMARPDLQSRLQGLGATVHASSPADFRALIAAEMQLWGKVVKDAGITAAN